MSVYDFEGRLRKTFGKDKLYFTIPGHWPAKFTYHIKTSKYFYA